MKMKFLRLIFLVTVAQSRKFSGQCERDAHFSAKEKIKSCRSNVFRTFGITDIEKQRQKTQT